jgi:hypothetical protein
MDNIKALVLRVRCKHASKESELAALWICKCSGVGVKPNGNDFWLA